MSGPSTDDCCVRLASNGSAQNLLLTYYEGNGLWLWDGSEYIFCNVNGAYQLIQTQNCMIDGVPGQAMVANSRYYAYAYSGPENTIGVDFSHNAPQNYGGTGFLFKSGTSGPDLTRRCIGGVQTDLSSNIWTAGSRGVRTSNIGSLYKRQRLNLQESYSGSVSCSGSTWTAVPGLYLSAWLWGDGGEPSCSISGSWYGLPANIGNTIYFGISIDGENPPYDQTLISLMQGDVFYPFAVNVSSGDYSDGAHSFQLMLKGPGPITILSSTLTLNLDQ